MWWMAGRIKFTVVISHNSLNPSSLASFPQMRNFCPEMLSNLQPHSVQEAELGFELVT